MASAAADGRTSADGAPVTVPPSASVNPPPAPAPETITTTEHHDASPATVAAVEPKPNRFKAFFTSLTTYARLLLYASPKPWDYALLTCGLISAIAAGIPFPMLGILFGQLVDDLNSATCSADLSPSDLASEQRAVNTKVLEVVYIAIGSYALIYIYITTWNLMGERLAQRLREKYLGSLLGKDAAFFDGFSSGEVASRLHGDIAMVQAGTSEKVGIVIASTSFFVTAYVVAFIKDSVLAGILVSLVPAFMAMSLAGGWFVEKYAGRMSDGVAKASAVASEALSNVAVVQVFGAGSKLEKVFSGYLVEARRWGVYKATAMAVQTGLLYFIAYSANALAFWRGSHTVADEIGGDGRGVSVGSTYTVIFLLVDATLILSQVAPFLQIFGSAAAAFEKLKKDIEYKPQIDGMVEDEGTHLQEVSGDISIRNVEFSYPSRPDAKVLKDVSIECPAGKHTAIVGLSGSGKSTLAGLITRLYDPNAGALYLDGHDLHSLNVRSLRGFVSLVQQEPSLLDRSILENIAHGLVNSPQHTNLRPVLMSDTLADLAIKVREGASLDAAAEAMEPGVAQIVGLVRQAAADADALHFISRLDYGFGTLVGTSGSLISGGQKQRIALARALIRNPKVLIMDEATASLDSQSEMRIQKAIEKEVGKRTLVSIAHRLATIKNADCIVVMRDGQVVERGTHVELMEKENGAYAALVKLQSVGIEKQAMDEEAQGKVSEDTISSEELEVEGVLDEKHPSKSEEVVPATPEPKPEADEPHIEGSKSVGYIFTRLWPLIRPYLFWLQLAFIAATIVGGTYSADAVIFGNTIGSLTPCNTPGYIISQGKFWGLMFFILGVIEFFANFFSWSLFGYIAEKLLYKVRVLSFRSLFDQDLQWHQSEGRSPALLLSFITKDGQALASLSGSIIGTIYSIVVNFLAAIIMSHVIAWRIALVCLAVVPIVLGAGWMQLRELSRFAVRHEEAFAKSIGIATEAVNNIKTVTGLSLEKEVHATYKRSLAAPKREVYCSSAYANFFLATAYSVSNFIYALAYWWGAKNITDGYSTQTQFFIILMALLVSAQLWGQMFTLAPDVSRARSAVARILNLLDIGSTKDLAHANLTLEPSASGKDGLDPEKAMASSPTSLTSSRGASITFTNISFSYPARPHIKILNNLTLTLPASQLVALVGPSGAGKSTILSLLCGLYHPSTGNITIDNAPLAKESRQDIALVPQAPALFSGSAFFNVSLGAREGVEPTRAEVQEACELACIHDVIAALPDGYDSDLGPGASSLSGGQRQRLSIARALVRRPRILVLDESTSALDAESEGRVMEALERVRSEWGTTVVVVAHRLRTVRRAGRIAVFGEGGVLLDEGSHEELMRVGRCEVYRGAVVGQMLE